MKLTKAQEKVINEVKSIINEAKSMTLEEYVSEKTKRWYNPSEVIELYTDRWNDAQNNIVVTSTNTRTLKALEKAGAVRIIEIGGEWTDRFEVLI